MEQPMADEPQDEDSLNREPVEDTKRQDKPASEADVKAALTKMHLAIVRGRSPNGKRASVYEQQLSSKWLTDNAMQQQPEPEPAKSEPSITDLRKAIAEHLRSELNREEPELMAAVGKKKRNAEDDDPMLALNGSGVVHATPEQIAAFDRGERDVGKLGGSKTTAAPKRNVELDPQLGDRIELGAGHFAIYKVEIATGRESWYGYGPRGENIGGHFCTKPSAAAVREFFEKFTSVGQAIAAGQKPDLPEVTPDGGDQKAVDEYNGDASTAPPARTGSLRVVTSGGTYVVKNKRD
jgi:hypothetical protein